MEIRILILFLPILMACSGNANPAHDKELFDGRMWWKLPNSVEGHSLGQPGQFGSQSVLFSSPTPQLRLKRNADQLTSQCTGLRAHLTSLSNLLKDDILEALAKRNEEIKGLEDKVRVLRGQVSALRKEVQVKDAVVAAQRKEVSQLQEAFAVSNNCQEKDRELAWLKSTFLNNSNWDTELHRAVNNKDEDKVKELVKSGNYIDARNKQLTTPLIRAAVVQDKDASLRIIKYLIDNGANSHAKDDGNRTFFHNLVGDGTTLTSSQFHDITEYLLSKNLSALFNMPGFSSGNFALHVAVLNIDVWTRTLSLLRRNGVNLNEVSEPSKYSIIKYALGGKRSLTFLSDLTVLGVNWRHLIRNDRNMLHLAANFGHVEGVNYYCKLGLNVNAVDSYGDTPLHRVALFGKTNVLATVEALIENGADLKIIAKDGKTALENALARNDMPDKDKVIKLLRDNA